MNIDKIHLANTYISFQQNSVTHSGTDDEKCKNIAQNLFGNDVWLSSKRRKNPFTKDFTVRRNYENLADCSMIYNNDNKLEYIAFQHHDGSAFSFGNLDIFDKDGKLLKTLNPKQVKTLRSYRGNLSYNLNSILRREKLNNPIFKEDIETMDSIFEDDKIPSSTEDKMIVYRGLELSSDSVQNIIKNPEFVEKGYMSTSMDKEVASQYGNYILRIEVPKGKKYLNMRQLTSNSEYYVEENEMLFNRNTKLLIKGFDPDTHTIYAQMK